MKKMTTILTIRTDVPKGKYCWQFTGDRAICQHFDNEGGSASCDIWSMLRDYSTLKRDDMNGYLKLPNCLALSE